MGDVTPEEARAMLRAVINLFERWDLTTEQGWILLGRPPEGLHQVPDDTVARLGALLGIHKTLRLMFTEPERGYAWIKSPNEAFGGRSALDRMLQGSPSDLASVRDYLAAASAS